MLGYGFTVRMYAFGSPFLQYSEPLGNDEVLVDKVQATILMSSGQILPPEPSAINFPLEDPLACLGMMVGAMSIFGSFQAHV